MHILLIVTGLIDAVCAVLQILFGLQLIRFAGQIGEPVHGILLTYNTGMALTLAFLASALLARGREVMGTGLGAGVLVLGMAVFASRALAEFVWLTENWWIAAACIAVGLLHLLLFFGVRVTRYIA
jgi:hypothetical protein